MSAAPTPTQEDVVLDYPPFQLQFRGAVESIGEDLEGVGDDGELITRCDGAKIQVEEGKILNLETQEEGDLTPGSYVLSEYGFFRERL